MVTNLLVGVYQGLIEVVDEYLARLKVHEYGTTADERLVVGIVVFRHPDGDGIHQLAFASNPLDEWRNFVSHVIALFPLGYYLLTVYSIAENQLNVKHFTDFLSFLF